jgi:hypothetical protein
MSKKMVVAAGVALALSAGSAMAQEKYLSQTVTCADINWSAEVLSNNPDIGQSCAAVYEKDGRLFAQVPIEVVRVRGNRMTFRPIHTDGTRGDSRSIQLDSAWRANIGGRQYRASDLMRGQNLNVYIPEDRFALTVADDEGDALDEAVFIPIEEEVVEMPTTASPLFLFGMAGGAFLALGGLLSGLRRRLS